MLYVQSYTWQNFPSLLFGMLSLVAGLLSVCLPETKNVPLPQTIDDAEKLTANIIVADLWSVRHHLIMLAVKLLHVKPH